MRHHLQKLWVNFVVLVVILYSCSLLYAKPLAMERKTLNSDQFISSVLKIDPIAMLDAEQRIEEAENAEKISDSLWTYVQMLTDSQQLEPTEVEALNSWLKNGLDLLSNDLKWLPDVRRIERHFNDLKLEDCRLSYNMLRFRANQLLFEAKTMNPYHPKIKIEKFQTILRTLIARGFPEENIRQLGTDCRKTKWLLGERNGFFNIMGTIYKNYEEWPRALACFDSAYQIVNQPRYPVGIDSSFAYLTDSIASKTFIANERREMAFCLEKEAQGLKTIHDSLITYYNFLSDSANFDYLIAADTIAARKFIDQALKYIDLNQRQDQKRAKRLRFTKYNLRAEDLQFVYRALFSKIEEKLLQAKEIDPFRANLRMNLGNDLYFKTANTTRDSSLYFKSVQEFENLVWIEKGTWVYYLYLGNAYMGTMNWQKAFENFDGAEKVFLKTAIFNLPPEEQEQYITKLDSVPYNSDLLGIIVFNKAEAKIRLYEGREALDLLRYAESITTETGMLQKIQSRINDVNWDEGNVHAMNLRRRAYEASLSKNFSKAKEVLLRLLEILWTQKTKDEINDQVALLDFQQLNNKEDGIDRMRAVVSPMPKDSEGAPLNPVNQRYFEHYGQMCWEFGTRFLLEDDRKLSYIYFLQATHFKWEGRPKAYLQLASLSEFDPLETISLCEQALIESPKLSPGEMRQTATLLSSAYQKQAKFKMAQMWHQKSLDKDWCTNREKS